MTVVDEVYELQANDWRYHDELGLLKHRPARVTAFYHAQSNDARVRLALMSRDDLERLRSGAPHEDMAITQLSRTGMLNYDVPEAGDYVIVVENQSAAPVSVRLRVRLQFSNVITLSRQRQLTVIAVSFLFFFATVTFSARRLLRGMKR